MNGLDVSGVVADYIMAVKTFAVTPRLNAAI
jgi:hypothetical protein